MDLYKLLGFVQILRESIQILSKNGRQISFIATLFFLLYSLFYLLNIFSINPLVSDLVSKLITLSSTIPSSPKFFALLLDIQKDAGLFLGVEIILYLAYFSVSLISFSAIIYVSSSYYNGKTFYLKEVLLKAIKSWKRPFLTMFFIILMSIGYMVLFILVIMVPQLFFSNHHLVSKSILIFLSILASILYLHFSVVWILGIVVSVMEEDCYGIEALGKSGMIVKGKRFDGFVLNLGWNLIFGVIYWVFMSLIKVKPGVTNQIIMGLVILFCFCLVGLFPFVAYTVLYFQCKKNHGEEIGVQRSMEYSKLPTIPIVHEDIP